MTNSIESLAIAYRKVFESPEGKVVLADIYKYTNIHESSFDPGNPYITSFNEGLRRVGLRIFSYLEIRPEDIRKIARQQQDDLHDQEELF
jgi:hypothetical protein